MNTPNSSEKNSPQILSSRLFTFLFGLPFATVSILMGLWVAHDAQKHTERKKWIEVPAQILSVKLKVHRGETATYSVEAKFQYQINGKTYQSDKVSAYSSSDNIGNFHKRNYEELKKYKQSQKDFRCYVNPSHPEEAILYRDYRIEMLFFQLVFVILFGLVGLGLVGSALFGSFYNETRYQKQNPQKPWLHRKEWFEGRIRSSNKIELLFLFFTTFVWNFISFSVFFLFYQDMAKHPSWLIFVIAIFPLIGLLLICTLIYRFLQWNKYGESIFEMATVPGEIGGKLCGTIYPTCPLSIQEQVEVSLKCVETQHIVREYRGKSETRIEKNTLWSERLQFSPDPVQEQTLLSEIPVLFSIPPYLPKTSTSNKHYKINWILEVTATVFGIDYHAKFEVPVFWVSDSPQENPQVSVAQKKEPPPKQVSYQKQKESLSLQTENLHLETVLNGLGIEVEPLSSGSRFVFPPFRHLHRAYSTFFLSAFLFILFVVLILLQTPVHFLWIALFFALWPILSSLRELLYKSQITVEPGVLHFSGGFLGMGTLHQYSLAEIDVISIQPENRAKFSHLYSIELRTKTQETYRLARFLGSEHYTLRFIIELYRILRQKEQS